MTTSSTIRGASDVPVQVFEKFLHELGGAGASPEMVARLRKALVEDKTFTEHALKEALFAEESLP
jgi:hypothetical protein